MADGRELQLVLKVDDKDLQDKVSNFGKAFDKAMQSAGSGNALKSIDQAISTVNTNLDKQSESWGKLQSKIESYKEIVKELSKEEGMSTELARQENILATLIESQKQYTKDTSEVVDYLKQANKLREDAASLSQKVASNEAETAKSAEKTAQAKKEEASAESESSSGGKVGVDNNSGLFQIPKWYTEGGGGGGEGARPSGEGGGEGARPSGEGGGGEGGGGEEGPFAPLKESLVEASGYNELPFSKYITAFKQGSQTGKSIIKPFLEPKVTAGAEGEAGAEGAAVEAGGGFAEGAAGLVGGAAGAAALGGAVLIGQTVDALKELGQQAQEAAEHVSDMGGSMDKLRSSAQSSEASESRTAANPVVSGLQTAVNVGTERFFSGINTVLSAFGQKPETSAVKPIGEDKIAIDHMKRDRIEMEQDIAMQRTKFEGDVANQRRDYALQVSDFELQQARKKADFEKQASREEQDYAINKAKLEDDMAFKQAEKKFQLERSIAQRTLAIKQSDEQADLARTQGYAKQDLSRKQGDENQDFSIQAARSGRDYQNKLADMATSGASGLDFLRAARDFRQQQEDKAQDLALKQQREKRDLAISQGREKEGLGIKQGRENRDFGLAQQDQLKAHQIDVETHYYEVRQASIQLEKQHARSVQDVDIALQRLKQDTDIGRQRLSNQKQDMEFDISQRGFEMDVMNFRRRRSQGESEGDLANSIREKVKDWQFGRMEMGDKALEEWMQDHAKEMGYAAYVNLPEEQKKRDEAAKAVSDAAAPGNVKETKTKEGQEDLEKARSVLTPSQLVEYTRSEEGESREMLLKQWGYDPEKFKEAKTPEELHALTQSYGNKEAMQVAGAQKTGTEEGLRMLALAKEKLPQELYNQLASTPADKREEALKAWGYNAQMEKETAGAEGATAAGEGGAGSEGASPSKDDIKNAVKEGVKEGIKEANSGSGAGGEGAAAPGYSDGGWLPKDMLANVHAGEYIVNPNHPDRGRQIGYALKALKELGYSGAFSDGGIVAEDPRNTTPGGLVAAGPERSTFSGLTTVDPNAGQAPAQDTPAAQAPQAPPTVVANPMDYGQLTQSASGEGIGMGMGGGGGSGFGRGIGEGSGAYSMASDYYTPVQPTYTPNTSVNLNMGGFNAQGFDKQTMQTIQQMLNSHGSMLSAQIQGVMNESSANTAKMQALYGQFGNVIR